MVVLRTRLGLAAVGLMIALIACSVTQAQRPGGQRGGPGGGMFRGPFGGGPTALVQRPDVQKELKLTESQIQQIREIADQQRSSLGNQFRQLGDLRNMSDSERREAMTKLQETRRQQQEEVRQKVKDVLNRSQQARFAELEFQSNVQRGDLAAALAASGAKLDPADAEKLRDAQQQAQAQLRDRITQLQREVYLEALGSVIDQTKIKRLMGESFSFDAGGARPSGRGPDRARAGNRRDRGSARTRTRDGQSEQGTDRRSRRRRSG